MGIAKPKVEVKKTVTKEVVVKPFKKQKRLSKTNQRKDGRNRRTYGVELDKRKKKDALVNELWKAIKK